MGLKTPQPRKPTCAAGGHLPGPNPDRGIGAKCPPEHQTGGGYECDDDDYDAPPPPPIAAVALIVLVVSVDVSIAGTSIVVINIVAAAITAPYSSSPPSLPRPARLDGRGRRPHADEETKGVQDSAGQQERRRLCPQQLTSSALLMITPSTSIASTSINLLNYLPRRIDKYVMTAEVAYGTG